MESDMLGPFKVKYIKGGIVSLANNTTKAVINIDLITPFTEPEERIPAKLKLATSPHNHCPALPNILTIFLHTPQTHKRMLPTFLVPSTPGRVVVAQAVERLSGNRKVARLIPDSP